MGLWDENGSQNSGPGHWGGFQFGAPLLHGFSLYENVGICNCDLCVKMYLDDQLCSKSKLAPYFGRSISHSNISLRAWRRAIPTSTTGLSICSLGLLKVLNTTLTVLINWDLSLDSRSGFSWISAYTVKAIQVIKSLWMRARAPHPLSKETVRAPRSSETLVCGPICNLNRAVETPFQLDPFWILVQKPSVITAISMCQWHIMDLNLPRLEFRILPFQNRKKALLIFSHTNTYNRNLRFYLSNSYLSKIGA